MAERSGEIVRRPVTIGIARTFYTLGAVSLVLTFLYIGRPVLVPIALSVLLAFILTPLIAKLEHWRLGRVPSVLVASVLAFSSIALCGWAVITQIRHLASELPNHRQEIRSKIESLSASGQSSFARVASMFKELGEDIGRPDEPVNRQDSMLDRVAIFPIPVVVQNEGQSPIESATAILLPIVEPLGQSALVVVLVLFLLIQREDMRFRLISLMGDAALTGTTRLMRDTAERVSNYLLGLFMVNAGFGLWFGIGLYFLGVPYAPLWGFLTFVLRFIPFLGSPASVFFPFVISIATSDGWTQPIYLLIFFVLSELFTNNVVETLVFGKSTGLTPVALIVAASFWAWIWGPVGLVLSTPLTVCLVVLGQHLPHFRSLKVLLAEQPSLDPRLQFFQRLLAGDAGEAQRVFNAHAAQHGRERAFDDVVIPALRWTRRERMKQVVTAEEEAFIYAASRATTADGTASLNGTDEELSPSIVKTLSVFGYPVHHESEEITLLMLEELLREHCIFNLATTKLLPSKVVRQIQSDNPDLVVLAAVPPGGIPQVRYMCSEIRQVCPEITIIVVCFAKLTNYDEMLVSLRGSGASYLTTSLGQTKLQIEKMLEELTPSESAPRPDDIRHDFTMDSEGANFAG